MLALALDAGANAGPLLTTLNAILGARFFHALHRHAQVAVVDERQRDQALQARVAEKFAPAQIGGGYAGFGHDR
ncbi:hypothetical protein D3C77_541940 [compost metagenome]